MKSPIKKMNNMNPYLFALSLSIVTSPCFGQLYKKGIDSIKVYYIDLRYKNIEPIKPDMLKRFPITKTSTIIDPKQLSLIRQKLNLLTIDLTQHTYFDTHMLCEFYYKGKRKALQANGDQFYYFNGRYYKPSGDLFALLYPEQ